MLVFPTGTPAVSGSNVCIFENHTPECPDFSKKQAALHPSVALFFGAPAPCFSRGKQTRNTKRIFSTLVIHNVDNLMSRFLILNFNDLDKLSTLCGKIGTARTKKSLLLSALRQVIPLSPSDLFKTFFRGVEQVVFTILQFTAVTSSPQSQTVAGGVSFAIGKSFIHHTNLNFCKTKWSKKHQP